MSAVCGAEVTDGAFHQRKHEAVGWLEAEQDSARAIGDPLQQRGWVDDRGATTSQRDLDPGRRSDDGNAHSDGNQSFERLVQTEPIARRATVADQEDRMRRARRKRALGHLHQGVPDW